MSFVKEEIDKAIETVKETHALTGRKIEAYIKELEFELKMKTEAKRIVIRLPDDQRMRYEDKTIFLDCY